MLCTPDEARRDLARLLHIIERRDDARRRFRELVDQGLATWICKIDPRVTVGTGDRPICFERTDLCSNFLATFGAGDSDVEDGVERISHDIPCTY